MLLFPVDRLEPPTFANLAPAQGQEEAVRLVRQVARGEGSPGAYLWGDAGFGKSHLLAAGIDQAARDGLAAAALGEDGKPAGNAEECRLLVVDDVERIGRPGQQQLLSFLSRSLDGERTAVLISGGVPARMLSLPADVRTRIEQLQSVRLGRLADSELERALVAYAGRCSRVVDVRVTQLLVHNCPRDMASLTRALLSVDRFALESGRSLSVGTVRSWLASRSRLL